MAIIVPTITAENPHVYREQFERINSFARRVHVDLMDGVFAPSKSIGVDQVWFPEDIVIDIHIMFQRPTEALLSLIVLKPNLIIVPAEAEFDFSVLREATAKAGVKLGAALLAETSVSAVKDVISELDHVLIFSGNLGYQGGSVANLDLLTKVIEAKRLNESLEIGWDGGVNHANVTALAKGGIDIINAGGYIHHAPDAGVAFGRLETLLTQTN